MKVKNFSVRVSSLIKGKFKFEIVDQVGGVTDFELTVLDSTNLVFPNGKMKVIKNIPLVFGITWMQFDQSFVKIRLIWSINGVRKEEVLKFTENSYDIEID